MLIGFLDELSLKLKLNASDSDGELSVSIRSPDVSISAKISACISYFVKCHLDPSNNARQSLSLSLSLLNIYTPSNTLRVKCMCVLGEGFVSFKAILVQ